MITNTDIAIEEARIRRLFDEWTNAVREKNIETLMCYYAPDIVAYDLIPPMQFKGIDAYRNAWQTGFDCMTGDVEFETRDVHLSVGEDIAFCHRLVRMAGTSKDGENFGCWMRWTTGLNKINGSWRITHEHISVPFDMETDKALMDLKP